MLIVVEHRNFQLLFQGLFDVVALRGFNVFQVDSAKCGVQQGTHANHIFRICGIHFQIEDIHVGKSLEQHSLALHHRLACQRADVPQTKHSSAVGNHGHQVPLGGVLVSIVCVGLDFQAGMRPPGV